MRGHALLILLGAVLVATTGTATAAENTDPLANAGVDRTVPNGTTVYLDANGSVDPDGEIVRVTWRIETPAGATVSPDCERCRLTEFEPDTVGRYTVTLTVTDDDDATSSDTIYVDVTNETGPDVSISGPSNVDPDSPVTFTANVTGDDSPLQTLAWVVNNSVVKRQSLNGSTTQATLNHSFDDSSADSLRVVVHDVIGQRGTATHGVTFSSGGTGPSRCSEGHAPVRLCQGAVDAVVTTEDQTIVYDRNNKPGFQLRTDGGTITTYTDIGKIPSIESTNNDGYKYTGEDPVRDILKRSEEKYRDDIKESIGSSGTNSNDASNMGNAVDNFMSIINGDNGDNGGDNSNSDSNNGDTSSSSSDGSDINTPGGIDIPDPF